MVFFKLIDYIYCLNPSVESEYISNIIKLIGQDELIKRVENGTIEFEVINQ